MSLATTPDDILQVILDFVRDATAVLNLATTNDVTRARIHRLALDVEYSREEHRPIPPKTRKLVVWDAQHRRLPREITHLTCKATESHELCVRAGVVELRISCDSFTTTGLICEDSSNLQVLETNTGILFGDNMIQWWGAPLTSMPQTLTRLRVPRGKINVRLPATLTDLVVHTIAPKQVFDSRLKRLHILHTTPITYADLPPTLTDYQAIMRRVDFRKHDFSRFKQFLYRTESKPHLQGFDESAIYGNADVLPRVLQICGPRQFVHVEKYKADLMPQALADCAWYISETRDYAALPKNVVKLAVDAPIFPNDVVLPNTLTQLTVFHTGKRRVIPEQLKNLTKLVVLNLYWIDGEWDVVLPPSVKSLYIAGEISLDRLRVADFNAIELNLMNKEEVIRVTKKFYDDPRGGKVVLQSSSLISAVSPATYEDFCAAIAKREHRFFVRYTIST